MKLLKTQQPLKLEGKKLSADWESLEFYKVRVGYYRFQLTRDHASLQG
jgi:hypothetical protein